ncbi:hypothetical protein MP638_001798 [Amoeboaphelidium occidentale]|nr:hypothetical protein MP638_001798 [Amoeboaphelidium occidentale]
MLRLDGPAGGSGSELTLSCKQELDSVNGSGDWVLWAEDYGKQELRMRLKDGKGSLTLKDFAKVEIMEKNGEGSLIFINCGKASLKIVDGPAAKFG